MSLVIDDEIAAEKEHKERWFKRIAAAYYAEKRREGKVSPKWALRKVNGKHLQLHYTRVNAIIAVCRDADTDHKRHAAEAAAQTVKLLTNAGLREPSASLRAAANSAE